MRQLFVYDSLSCFISANIEHMTCIQSGNVCLSYKNDWYGPYPQRNKIQHKIHTQIIQQGFAQDILRECKGKCNTFSWNDEKP